MGCAGVSGGKGSNLIKRVDLQPNELQKLRETALTQSRIETDYMVCTRLGETNNVKQYLVKNSSNLREFCMKVIKRQIDKELPSYIQNISQLRKFSHPNLLTVVDFYEDEVNFYMVSEMPRGKELYETMRVYNNFSERTAGRIFYQLASLMYYFHSKGIFHGHLRPDIIFIESETKSNAVIHKNLQDKDINFHLFLFDYGEVTNFTGNYYDEVKRIEKICKPYYTAPEVLKKKNYNEKVDIFSAGVILYTLFCGKPPFYGIDNNEIKQSICDGEWEFDGPEWKDVSSAAKDLISRMLHPNPNKRISSKEILIHTWVVYSKEEEHYSQHVMTSVMDNLSKFHARDQLQQATMAFICNQIANSSQVKELKKLFKTFDKNGDGVLSYDEFGEGYTRMYGKGLTGMELNKLIEQIDKDKSGKIEYEEFLSATIEHSKVINDQNLKAAFNKFDADGSGKLSIDELTGLVGNDADLVLELINKVDKNNDGEIDFEEFKKLMTMMVGEKEKAKKEKSKKEKKKKKKYEKDKDKDKKDKKEKKDKDEESDGD
ncbi:MAG: protein kinase family protein [bacterium]